MVDSTVDTVDVLLSSLLGWDPHSSRLWEHWQLMTHSCPLLWGTVLHQSSFLKVMQRFQGLYFGLGGGSLVLRMAEQQSRRKLFICWLRVSASGIFTCEVLGEFRIMRPAFGSSWFCEKEKPIILCLCLWLQVLFNTGFSRGWHWIDDCSRQKSDHLTRHSLQCPSLGCQPPAPLESWHYCLLCDFDISHL